MAAGFTWVRGTPEQFVSTPAKAVQTVTKSFDMGALVEDAANLMKEMIATRGTGKVWSRPGPTGRTGSFPGRIDTGEMWGDVKWRVSIGEGSIVGEFGWLDNKQPYYLYQEEGFTHVFSGEYVAGMLALEDAGIQANEEFLRRLSQALR